MSTVNGNGKSNNNVSSSRIKYQKGELIYKEGSFGNCVYTIIEGAISLFKQQGDREIPIADLRAGEIFGESCLFNNSTSPNNYTARAAEDAILELKLASTVLKDIESLPPLLKEIGRQALRRLYAARVKTAQLTLNQITAKKQNESSTAQKRKEWAQQQRRHYRKQLNISGEYRPLGQALGGGFLEGRIKDISKEGVGLEASGRALNEVSHEVGDKFDVRILLPNGKKISFTAQIVTISGDKAGGIRFCGMKIIEISYENQKTLGFFLMP